MYMKGLDAHFKNLLFVYYVMIYRFEDIRV